MKKSFLNSKHENSLLDDYCDKENKRFLIETQKDAEQLYGKIRRLSGRDEIRKNAIKIIVRKRLDIPDKLLSSWEDLENHENEDILEEVPMSTNVSFKYIPKAERDAMPSSDFGYVKGERRLFPVRNQEDLDAASHLIGRAKGLNDKDRENVKKKLKAIAKRKGLSIPKAWDESAEMSALVTIS